MCHYRLYYLCSFYYNQLGTAKRCSTSLYTSICCFSDSYELIQPTVVIYSNQLVLVKLQTIAVELSADICRFSNPYRQILLDLTTNFIDGDSNYNIMRIINRLKNDTYELTWSYKNMAFLSSSYFHHTTHFFCSSFPSSNIFHSHHLFPPLSLELPTSGLLVQRLVCSATSSFWLN